MKWFPTAIIGLISVVIALNVLPVLLAPFSTALGLALLLLPAIWVIGKLQKRSAKQKDHK